MIDLKGYVDLFDQNYYDKVISVFSGYKMAGLAYNLGMSYDKVLGSSLVFSSGMAREKVSLNRIINLDAAKITNQSALRQISNAMSRKNINSLDSYFVLPGDSFSNISEDEKKVYIALAMPVISNTSSLIVPAKIGSADFRRNKQFYELLFSVD